MNTESPPRITAFISPASVSVSLPDFIIIAFITKSEMFEYDNTFTCKTYGFKDVRFFRYVLHTFQGAAQSTVATPYDEAMLLIESVKYQ